MTFEGALVEIPPSKLVQGKCLERLSDENLTKLESELANSV